MRTRGNEKNCQFVSNQINGKKIQLQLVIIGVPLQLEDDQNGAVFIYQSFEVGEETTQRNDKIYSCLLQVSRLF